MLQLSVAAGALFVIVVTAAVIFTFRTIRWGATPEECSMRMPGDEYFTGGPSAFVAMTRAISIESTPATVWPWLAQMGRGAGWYSFDRLDNGGKVSARHASRRGCGRADTALGKLAARYARGAGVRHG
jgi:hypothetical protein